MSVWGRDALDKLAANYLAFIHLASIRLWLRVRSSRRIDPTFSA
jgi:hypothetical protein